MAIKTGSGRGLPRSPLQPVRRVRAAQRTGAFRFGGAGPSPDGGPEAEGDLGPDPALDVRVMREDQGRAR